MAKTTAQPSFFTRGSSGALIPTFLMHGFLWLLIQMALLLLAAAVVFFLLGWRWRGQNATLRIADLNAQIDAESRATETARRDREAAQTAMSELKSSQLREAADLQEAQDRLRGLEREILRLADELKTARSHTPPPPLVATLAEPVELPTAAAEMNPAPNLPIESAPPVPAKKSRPKKAASVPMKPAKAPTGRQVLTRLQKSLDKQMTLVNRLRAKNQEDQVRADTLKSAKDRAALRLATKDLKQSSTELAEAVASLESLKRQIEVVSQALATPPVPGAEDDLTRIKSIEGTLHDQLRSLGVCSYRQIALWSDEEAEAWGELLGIKKNATRSSWRTQARELHMAKHGTEPS